MKLFVIILSTRLVISLASGSPSDELEASSGSDIEEITEKLYSRDKQMLEPSETFDLLNKLEQKYRNLNDGESIRKYSKIMSLINAKQVDKNYCNSYRGGFSSLAQDNSTYPNIKAYLESIISQQSQICKLLLDASLKRNVNDLSENMQEDVELLRASVAVENGGNSIGIYQDPPQEALIRGFLLYLERRFGPLIPKMMPKEQGKKTYRGYSDRVFTLCRQVVKKLEEPMRIHEQFSFDEKELDKNTINWLENRSICRAIRADSDSIFRDSYQMLLDKLSEKFREIRPE